MENENFEGFAGHTAEQQRNLTDEQMVQTIHENPQLFNLVRLMRDGTISGQDVMQLIADKEAQEQK